MSKALVKKEANAVERYAALVDELQALKTEEAFDMAVQHVKWSHEWGRVIREHYSTDQGMENLLSRLAVDVSRSKRTLYRYIELYDRFPNINDGLSTLGKSVSINKLIGHGEEEKEEEDKPECEHNCARHCKL